MVAEAAVAGPVVVESVVVESVVVEPAAAEPRPVRPSRFVAATLGLGLVLIAGIAIGSALVLAAPAQGLRFTLLAGYGFAVGAVAVVGVGFNLVALRGGPVPERAALLTVLLTAAATVLTAAALLVPGSSVGSVLAFEVVVIGAATASLCGATWVAARRAAARRAAARRAAAAGAGSH